MSDHVDIYLKKAKNWQQELIQLRAIVLDCGLTEDFKWRNPCYTYQGRNIVLISAFKEYCALTFFKGVLLNDNQNILVRPGENSQSSRLVHFTNLSEIIDLEPLLKSYLAEAIEIEKEGLKVNLKDASDYSIPSEFQIKLDKDLQLKKAFSNLTPGRQKAYLLHFSAAKQAKTRESRVEKYIPRILKGKGFNDCVCGLSNKMPACDGSHQKLNSRKN